MDCNEFSFDALFNNGEFKIYESRELLEAFKELNIALESHIGDESIRSHIGMTAMGCASEAQRASFEQGFCFAVKLIKSLMRI